MLRFIGVVLIGMGLGLALVAMVVVIGKKPSTNEGVTAAASVSNAPVKQVGKTETVAVEPPARVEDVITTVYPSVFYLWQDGYPSDPSSITWTTKSLESLSAYLVDWQLPPEVPDKLGRLSHGIEAHISRQHPERFSQFVRTVDHSCQVWIERPLAQEEITWEGDCKDGLAEGEGVLTRSYVLQGELYEIGYQGPMRAGKAHGAGKTVDANFMMYKGEHAEGFYHGEGSLTDLGYDGVFTYVGRFQNGYPDGFGRKQQDNRVLEGTWRNGCYEDDGQIDRILRHEIECLGQTSAELFNTTK